MGVERIILKNRYHLSDNPKKSPYTANLEKQVDF
jgi:hypothetical protein